MGVDWEVGTQAQVYHACAKGAHHIIKLVRHQGVRFMVQTNSSLLPQV